MKGGTWTQHALTKPVFGTKAVKNIKPHKIKDNNIEAHFRHNPTPAFTFNSPKKQEFDHTPVTHRNVSFMAMSLRKSRI